MVLLFMLVLVVVQSARHSGKYLQCVRRACVFVNDKDVQWEFDQPVPSYVEEEDGDIRRQLAEYRMKIRYN